MRIIETEDGAWHIAGDYIDLWDLRQGIDLALEKGQHRVPIRFGGQIKPVKIERMGDEDDS